MKMKKITFLLILLTCLAGCKTVSTDQEDLATEVTGDSQGNSSAEVDESSAYHHCAGGLCIEIKVDEPLVFGESITVRITATTEEDVPDLGVALTFFPFDNIIIEDPDKEEEGIVVSQKKSGITWKVDAKAIQPVTFVRKFTTDFPLIEDHYYLQFWAQAHDPRGLVVAYSIYIFYSQGEVKVYYPGDPAPTSEHKTKYEGTEPPIHPTPGVTIYPTREPTMTAIPTMRWSTPIPTVNPYPIITPQPIQPTPTLPPYP
jgi:hypothetical protein